VTELPRAVPSPGRRNLAVRVTRDAGRQIRSGHPWVFDASITSVRPDDGAAGDLAVVFDSDRRFMAVGLWDPASPIRIKVLHHGAPRTIDESFWQERIDAAVALRRGLAERGDTDSYRVIHGENDGLPGLVVDRYASISVVKLYSAAWFPHLGSVLEVIASSVGTESCVLRLGRNVAAGETFGLADGDTVSGPPVTSPVDVIEHGLTFRVDVVRGQKTGHFLDQRDNRARVGSMSRGARVLDVFSSTGGFTVHAAAGGARSVRSVDLNPQSIEALRTNLDLNRGDRRVAACRTDQTVGDAFEVMAGLARQGERYDIVVIDPPSFASKQADVEGALRAYGRLTSLGLALVRTGGTLVQASCSSRVSAEAFHEQVLRSAGGAGVALHELARTGHAVDHPVGFREGAYLKAVFATAER